MGLGMAGFRTAAVFGLTGYWLTKWSENNFQYNADSVPLLIRCVFAFFAAAIFVETNRYICSIRLGVTVTPIFIYALILQLIVLAVVGFVAVLFCSIGSLVADKPKKALIILGAFACFTAAFALDYLFHLDIGDLAAEMKPTKRCNPSGYCYSVGSEQWGGNGALVVMSVNLAQGVFILVGLGALLFCGWEKVKLNASFLKKRKKE